jgi:hypothetical protein
LHERVAEKQADSLRLLIVRWSRRLHSHVSRNLNARPENVVNLEELLATIKAEWTKLGPLIGLEVVPQGSRTEGGLTVGSRTIERIQRSGA